MEEIKEEREGKRALGEERALARASRHFARVKGGTYNKKVVHSSNQLLYILAIRWAIDDMAMAYSQQLAILLAMLSYKCILMFRATHGHLAIYFMNSKYLIGSQSN